MEMAELVRTWKKFGRPQILTNMNSKETVKEREIEDPIDEAMGLLFGWLRQGQSQQIMLLFILTGIVGTSAFSVTPDFTRDFWTNSLLMITAMITISVTIGPIIATYYLIPFKWSLLNTDQRELVFLNLVMMNVFLVLAVVVSLFVSLTNVFGLISMLLVFGFGVGAGFCSERIRLGVVRRRK